MKIVIAGCGIVGTALAERLAIDKHNVTIIDIDDSHINFIQNTLDVMCIRGDAVSPDVQLEADTPEADLFIAVTNSDEQNLLACLLAKKLGAKNTIARVRTTQSGKAANILKEEMGLSMVINPELDAAREIFNSLKYKPVGQVESLAKGSTEIITCVVKPDAPICNMAVKDIAKATGARILICGIKRDNLVFIPSAGTIIKPNDTLSFAAETKETLAFFKAMKYDTEPMKSLAIIGGSKLGVFLARRVLETGVPVKIIDNDKARCKQLLTLVPEAEIICADGTEKDVIDEERIDNSSVIVAATDDDPTNTMIALYFTKTAPDCKVVLKIKKSDFEEMLFGMNIGSVYNPKYIAVDNIERYVKAMQDSSVSNEIESVCHVIDNKVSILEFNISAGLPHLNEMLMDITFKKDLLIAIIYRDGKPFTPGGKDCILEGDIVIVATTQESINRFSDIFSK